MRSRPAAFFLITSVLFVGWSYRCHDGYARQLALPRPADQVITAEDIASSGILRLSDLFGRIDGWNTTSVDDYSFSASANGLRPAGTPAWLLLLDGQLIDLRVLDGLDVNSLPITLSEIDSVEVINTPTWIAGTYAPAGALHVHTRRPEPGISFRSSAGAANEVGDPGPFRYTAFDSPNIDRIGPTFEGALSAAGRGWHARIQGRADEHHATDERMRTRVYREYVGEKDARLFLDAGSLDLGVHGRFGTHSLFAGGSRLQDLHYVESLGMEAPREHRYLHAGARGVFEPGSRIGIRYQFSYETSSLPIRPSRDGIDFDWRQNRFVGRYEVYGGTTHWQAGLGFSADVLESVTGYPLADGTLTVPRAYVHVARLSEGGGSFHVLAHVARSEEAYGYGFFLGLRFRPDPWHTLVFSGSWAQMPFASTNSTWYWVAQGYDFFGTHQATVTLPSVFDAQETATADLAWSFHPSSRVSLTLFGAYRRFTHQTLARRSFEYDPVTTALSTETILQGSVSGTTHRAGATLLVRLIPTLDQQLYYAYLRYPTEDAAFYEAWRNQPWHRASYTLRWNPVDRFSLYARLVYLSATEWPAYRSAADAAGGLYLADLPDYFILDMAAEKKFWDDHLRLSLSLHNFLNEPYRQHPAGAVTQMVWRIRLTAYVHARTR